MSTRKLAAILFADIVGYTALMQKDEQQALARLQRFKEALEAQVPTHRGEIMHFYGDGCLAIFDSSVDAVSCAKLLQEQFVGELDVPVRLGLHTGEVMLRDGNVYGNAVNVASRVESMAVPGAVLLSSSVRNQVKNQQAFELTSMGRFEFKNVEGGMTIYALANEGLIVPDAAGMEAKLKTPTAPSKTKRKWLFPAMFATIILMGILVIWQMTQGPASLSQADRAKRVTVLEFDNKTDQDELNSFGAMISDWVTKGLMESGEANVISAANIEPQIQRAGLGNVGSPALAQSTGVGITIQGRYYLQQDQLMIQGNIVDATEGKVIYALDPIQGPQQDMLDLLKQLTDAVLNYWAVKERPRFLQHPPNYEAVQSYREAFKYFATDFQQAQKLLLRATELDSTFHAPLLKMIPLYRNFDQPKVADSIIAVLEKKEEQLTRWEQLRLASLIERNRNLLRAAQLNEERYRMDSSDANACYNAAQCYSDANYPQKAIDILMSFDQRYRKTDSPLEVDWWKSKLATAYFLSENYQGVFDVVASYDAPKIIIDMAACHLFALIRVDSLKAVHEHMRSYQQKGIYSYQGQMIPTVLLCQGIFSQAFLLENDSLLNSYIKLYEDWVNDNFTNPVSRDIFFSFFKKDLIKYTELLEGLIDEMPPPAQLNMYKGLGYAYGLSQQPEPALRQLELLDQLESDNLSFLQEKAYNKAIILAALGQKAEAVQALQESISLGKEFSIGTFKYDVFLMPLFGYPPFEELVRPKG